MAWKLLREAKFNEKFGGSCRSGKDSRGGRAQMMDSVAWANPNSVSDSPRTGDLQSQAVTGRHLPFC